MLEQRSLLTAVNAIPIASNYLYATSEDTPLFVAASAVPGNAGDGDFDQPAASVVSEPAMETLGLLATASVSFSLDTFGAEHVYPGHALYVGFSGVRTAGTSDDVYVSVSSLPAPIERYAPGMARREPW
jgi:hypothetical protein